MEKYSVEGHADLARDPHTNSIINVNRLDYEQYVSRRATKEEKKIYDISPKPAVPLEVRICVLNCKDIAMNSEGIVDAYFRGFFDTNEEI